MKNFIFFANNNIGTGLSGGDRIFIEFLKNWHNKSLITLFACQETINLCKKYQVSNVQIIPIESKINKSNYFQILSLIKHNLVRTYRGVVALLKNKTIIKNTDYLYSVSDFYPDFIPALIAKIINPKATWIAGYYLFAPNPFAKDSPYKKNNFLKGLLYWLIQIPSYYLIKRMADIIFVTSQPDEKKFPNKKVYIIQGGVDTKPSQEYFKKKQNITKKIYDALFIGRLHYQKGVVELIDIWEKVIRINSDLKLAIIGDGELKNHIEKKIIDLKLQKNIILLGFLDGQKKYNVFKMSKLVVHPATYDSGGMAAAEAMAWGLPGVSYDLEALKTYYPKGMIKTKCFDQEKYAENIIELLNNKIKFHQISSEAREYITKNWDWETRSNKIFSQITKL